MKYLRKIVALIIAVVFVAALAIGIGVIFAVRNVNVTLLSYSQEENCDGAVEEIAEFKSDILDEVRGTMINFVSEEQVASVVKDGRYVLDGLEKVYPCTLNVTLKERREALVAESGGVYKIYDENGGYLRETDSASDAVNPVDGAPNLIIEGAENEEDIKQIASICAIFKSKFSSLRSVAESVTLQKAKSQLERDRIIFLLRCGISVEIQDYTALTAEKIAAGYNQFISLTGEQKLGGKIYCFVNAEGTVAVTYNAHA